MASEPLDISTWSTSRLLAHLYDWEHDAYDEDVSFYVALAQRTGGPVLELACGSGRVLEPLIQLGLEVVGLDTSPDMLERARRRLAGARPTAQLLQQKMEGAFPAGEFSLVMLALNALGFLPTVGAQRRVLREAAAHLTSDGLLVIDVVNPAALADAAQGIPILQQSGVDEATGAHVTKWMVQQLFPAEQRYELRSFYDVVATDGRFTRVNDRIELRYYGRYELELLLEQAGLEIDGLYGDYEAGPFADDSERMIFVTRASRSAGR